MDEEIEIINTNTKREDPPEISTILIQKTKQFTDQNIEMIANKRQAAPVCVLIL